MFERCETALAPLGGITVDMSPSGRRVDALIRLRDAIVAAPSLILEPSGHVARHKVGCCAAQSNRLVQSAATNLVNKTFNILFESSPRGRRYR